MKKINFIIDGSNLAYRQQYAFQTDLQTESGETTTVIYGFLRSLLKLKQEFRSAQFWVVWDGSIKRKRAIYSNYKAQREVTKEKEQVYQQIQKLKEILPSLGIKQLCLENEEADDTIASLVCRYSKNDLNYIYANDRDFLQLVQDGKIVVLMPQKGQYTAFDEAEVIREFDIHPSLLAAFRALDGDHSDNLPRIPFIKKKLLVQIIEKYHTIDALYSSNFSGISIKDYEKLKEFEQQAKINYQLMKLKEDLQIDNIETPIEFNLEKLAEIFEHYQFSSSKLEELAQSFGGKTPFFKTGVEIVTL